MNPRLTVGPCLAAMGAALFVAFSCAASGQTAPAPQSVTNLQDNSAFVSLFDGKTLDGWDGKPGLWRVEDGTIVAEITAGMFPEKIFPNTFLIKRGVEARDFDLKLEIKMEKGGGSGIQYRSSVGFPPGKAGDGNDPRWTMTGPQADFWYPVNAEAGQWSGQFYSQNTSRGTIAKRGQVVQARPGNKPQPVGAIGDIDKLGALVKTGEWNQYTIIARGGVMMHIINGQLMAVLIDDDPASAHNVSGLFGLQIEGVPSKVSFRNIFLKKIN